MGEERQNPSIRISDHPQENQSTVIQFLKSLSVIGQGLGDLGPVPAIIAFLWQTFGTSVLTFLGLQSSDSQQSGDEAMSSPSPQQPERSSRGKRKAGRHENRRSAKSKPSPGRQSDSGASSSYDSDASGSDSNEIPPKKLTLEDTLQQLPQSASVGQFGTTHKRLPGAIDTIAVVAGPKGSSNVGRIIEREDRGEGTKKLVSASPGQDGKGGGKAVGEILNHSTSSGETVAGAGPGAAEEALRLHLLWHGPGQGQVRLAPTTQPPEAAPPPETSRKKKSRKEKESKEGLASILDVKDGATLTGKFVKEHAEEGSVTAVVVTGPDTTDGIVYDKGVTVRGQTNVAVKIPLGQTKSANGIVSNGDGDFQDVNVLMTDKENLEKAMEAFKTNPFFSEIKKKFH